MAFWWKATRSATLSPERVVAPGATTTAPPTTSLCPPAYFVVLWTTTSAPRAMGVWRYGLAKVLSTTSRAPASCATSARASMSAMPRSGFVGVSTHTIRVSGRRAARTESTSATVPIEWSTPQRRTTRSKRR